MKRNKDIYQVVGLFFIALFGSMVMMVFLGVVIASEEQNMNALWLGVCFAIVGVAFLLYWKYGPEESKTKIQ